MSRELIQDHIIAIADIGVWFFLAFIGAQVCVVIFSTLIRRRKVLPIVGQVTNARKEILNEIHEALEYFRSERGDFEKNVTKPLRKLWRRNVATPCADVGSLLRTAAFLQLERREQTALQLIQRYKHCLGNDISNQKELAVNAVQAGLLGTVLGSIRAIGKMALNGKGDHMHEILAALSFALWTTVAGLVIALSLRMTLRHLAVPMFTKLDDEIEDAFLDICIHIADLQTRAPARLMRTRRPASSCAENRNEQTSGNCTPIS